MRQVHFPWIGCGYSVRMSRSFERSSETGRWSCSYHKSLAVTPLPALSDSAMPFMSYHP